MACAELDVIVTEKFFDKKYEAGAKTRARSVAEKALKSAFQLEAPKDKQQRYWSVDLKLVLTLNGRKLAAGCGVIVNFKQGSGKTLHFKKDPNSATVDIDPAKIKPADVDGLIGDAVDAVMATAVAKMKADAGKL